MNNQQRDAEFDAIVVGSGPGGATVARELSRKSKKVLLLERGGAQPLTEGFRTIASIINGVPAGDKLVAARAFTTGGTTALYFAVADEPPLASFKSLGIDLSCALEEARRELPLTEVPDTMLGVQAKRVRESAIAMGLPWKKKMMLVDLSKCPTGYAYEAKWNARSYVRDAIVHGATLVTRAMVSKVILDKNRAVGVEYTVPSGKKSVETRRAYGTRVVLSAGGAASPIILRDSGMPTVATNGFYCHPSLAVFGLVSGLNAGETFVGSMSAEIEDGMAVGDANFARTFYRLFMLRQARFVRAFAHSRSIGVGVAVMEGLSGELRENGRYHKQLHRDDLEKLRKGERIAREIIRRAGGKRIFSSAPAPAHIGGTIRIKEHVDQTLQTEYSHLHVCDGSVIPEQVKVSPTLTLICLGKYLANHLATAC